MATENLKVKITADASQAKAEIGKFKDTLKSSVAAGDSATKTLAKLTAATGALAAAIKAVKSAVKTAIEVAAAGDAIKDNAQKVFMGTAAYQEWGYVLKQNGVNMGALKVGMRKFSQEVATGSDALRRYGITATDVDTAFSQAVATIQNMSSETEKIAAATELFGSRALELFPVLNLTNAETQNLMASYRALGGTMSNELIAASDVCTDSITAMKAAWGGLRNVLAAYVIPVVTKVVQWITVAIAKVRILLAAILGIKETFGGGGKKSLPATTASVAKSTGNTANNLKKATKQAKELRRTMMGIDELSRLAEKATSGSSSGGTPSGGGVSVPSVGGDVGSFDGIISDETLAKIQNFQEKIDAVKDKLHGAYLILKGLVEISLGNLSQGWTDIKDGIALVFPNLDSLKTKWENMKKTVEAKIEAAKVVLEDKFSAVWTTVKGVWDTITTTIGDKAQTAKAVLEDKFSAVWTTVKGVWDTIAATIGGKAQTAKAVLEDKFSAVWTTVKGVWDTVTATIGGKTQTAKAVLTDGVSSVWTTVKGVWDTMKTNLQDLNPKVTLSDGVSKVAATVQSIWESLRNTFLVQKGKNKGKGKTISAKIKIGLTNNFSKAWDKVKKKWNSLAKFGTKKATIEIGFKNLITSAWNKLAGAINSAKSKAPKIIADILPTMPTLAKGGILTAPTPAFLGEYAGARSNPEIATPQSLMADTMRDVNGDLVSAFAQMTRQVIAAIEDKDLSVRIGDEAIARSAQRGNAAYRNRTGKALLSI